MTYLYASIFPGKPKGRICNSKIVVVLRPKAGSDIKCYVCNLPNKKEVKYLCC